jgi:hypothetical protein
MATYLLGIGQRDFWLAFDLAANLRNSLLSEKAKHDCKNYQLVALIYPSQTTSSD